MDMGGMDMGGMDMSNGYTLGNKDIAKIYWYIIIAFVGLMLLLNATKRIIVRQRIKRASQNASYPAAAANSFEQAFATMTAIVREASLPSSPASCKPFWARFSPPPLGRSLILLAYITTIVCMLVVDAIERSPMYYEKIGYRAAWTTVTQIPFVYLLAGKQSILTLFTGISYERINWFHRWVGRVTFASASVHMAFFMREWALSDFFQTEIEMMPMVKYGLGAYSVLGWMLVTSVIPMRYWIYELFVLNHLASAGALLWALWMHIPAYAMYNVWLAIGFLAADRIWRSARFTVINFNFLGRKNRGSGVGYQVDVVALDGTRVTEIIIRNANFSWRAGQHLYISVPLVRPFESHPFSISNCMPIDDKAPRDIRLNIKAHAGFTKSLFEKAVKLKNTKKGQQQGPPQQLAFVEGPFGTPPRWTSYGALVLIATCTRITFILPVLEEISRCDRSRSCVGNVSFCWIVRQRREAEHLLPLVKKYARAASDRGIDIKVHLFVTCRPAEVDDVVTPTSTESEKPQSTFDERKEPVGVRELKALEATGCVCDNLSVRGPGTCCCGPEGGCCGDWDDAVSSPVEASWNSSSSSVKKGGDTDDIPHKYGRPDIEKIIQPTVDAADGETAIAVCTNPALTSRIRNFVAKMCDDRAVEKGTGADGILLFTEGWM